MYKTLYRTRIHRKDGTTDDLGTVEHLEHTPGEAREVVQTDVLSELDNAQTGLGGKLIAIRGIILPLSELRTIEVVVEGVATLDAEGN